LDNRKRTYHPENSITYLYLVYGKGYRMKDTNDGTVISRGRRGRTTT
jgi:hypothetical protein